jgi:general secretion pathway protein M
MIEKLLQSWRMLAARERRMVIGATLVVALAIGYQMLFEPAWRGRTQLATELPQMRSQLAQMTALAAEARALGAGPRAGDSPQALRTSLQQSVAAAGLADKLTQLSLNGELFDLRFAAVPYASWLAWLDTTLRETRLRVADLAVSRDAAPGIVSVRLVLEAPRREGR